jgi:hypothetical protein
MGDEFHRPTLTFPDGAYNASQVRLYGLPGSVELVAPRKDTSKIKAPSNKDEEARIKTLEFIERLSREKDIGILFKIELDMRKFGKIILSTTIMGEEYQKKGKVLSCGIIVGYSYEGHCYDLPKPKIMLIPTFPEELPPDDCGYDRKNDPPSSEPDRYMVWIVDKLDECVEFEMNQGFVEQLVLDANMPGKRSPTMYASRMQMGHRSGRLSE